MRTIDKQFMAASPDVVWPRAVNVEQWPELLSHYRWVTRQQGEPGGDGVVEMAAWRPFGGPLKWPTWWRSQMWVDAAAGEIRYQHIGGITTGMAVLWQVQQAAGGGTMVTITHEWSGPQWPVIGRFAADEIIGPIFVHGIASRTLAGLARAAERAK
jgi:hypothetical protein